MKIVHLANTDFEFELTQSESIPIFQAWSRNPLCLQLQFLPILYAEADDVIAVTACPNQEFINHLMSLGLWEKDNFPHFIDLHTFFSLPYTTCLSWGFSKRVQKWAQARQLTYPMPDWQIVQMVNSKEFSFKQSPFLEESSLIYNEQELVNWLKIGSEKKVLKTCFGLSGKGNRFIQANSSLEQIRTFCEKEWKQKRPIIGEPWLDRIFDFSTQWNIIKQGNIQFIGATVFKTDSKGCYQGTWAGPESILFHHYQDFLEEHKKVAFSLVEKIASMGFFGPVGIDAFLYLCPTKGVCLRAVVEINGRQTMSLMALRFQRRWYPDQAIELSFSQNTSGVCSLLPTQVRGEKGEITFPKTLSLSFPDPI